jgi:hypothetical protein
LGHARRGCRKTKRIVERGGVVHPAPIGEERKTWPTSKQPEQYFAFYSPCQDYFRLIFAFSFLEGLDSEVSASWLTPSGVALSRV